MGRQQEEVVDEAGGGDRLEAAPHVAAQQPLGVGLVLDLVADAGEPLAALARAQRVDPLGDVGRREVDPADDGRDEPVGGRRLAQQVRRLLLARRRLHDHGRADAGRPGDREQVVEPPRPAQHLEVAGHPRVVAAARVPQVVVGVDDHDLGRSRSPCIPPSTASAVPVVDAASGLTR